MTVVEALRAELDTMPDTVSECALAATALDIARRLDANPGDDAVVRLSRELRLLCIELAHRAGTDSTSDVETFLARIAGTDFGDAAN